MDALIAEQYTVKKPLTEPISDTIFEEREYGITPNGRPESGIQEAKCIVGNMNDIEIVDLGERNFRLKNDVLIPGDERTPNILVIDMHHKSPIYIQMLIDAGVLTSKIDKDFEDAHRDALPPVLNGEKLNEIHADNWVEFKKLIPYLRISEVNRIALLAGQLASLKFIRTENVGFIDGGGKGRLPAWNNLIRLEGLIKDFPEVQITENEIEHSTAYARRSEHSHILDFDIDRLVAELGLSFYGDQQITREQIQQLVEVRRASGYDPKNYDLIIVALSPGYTDKNNIKDIAQMFIEEMIKTKD